MTEEILARHQALSNAARLPLLEPMSTQGEAKRAVRRFRHAYHQTHALLNSACDPNVPVDLEALGANVNTAYDVLFEAQMLPLTRVGVRARVTAMDNRDVAEEALGVARRRNPVVPAHLRERPSKEPNVTAVLEVRHPVIHLKPDWNGAARVIIQVGIQPYSIKVPPLLTERFRQAVAVQELHAHNPYAPKLVLWVTKKTRLLKAVYFE